jgi:hypothetical protein
VKALENSWLQRPALVHTICICTAPEITPIFAVGNSFAPPPAAGMLIFTAAQRSAACRVTAQVSGCWRTSAAKLLQLALGDAAADTPNEHSTRRQTAAEEQSWRLNVLMRSSVFWHLLPTKLLVLRQLLPADHMIC